MNWSVHECRHGFTLLETRAVTEAAAEAMLFLHKKSGAKVLFLASEDDNKVFSISFRTPPADDTGIAHILEHSVLCGSRKYPLKEPFVELVKGSLNTFLNAMTFPDKTMYPVASRNDRDFRNLTDVYLDAVFFPNIYTNRKIMQQEGWHYELTGPDESLAYKGVVYNEMKGVFSSPDAVMEQTVMGALFPDTPYRFESGGDPVAIPQLSQERFEAFHKTYYHPSNSYIYLYGNLDIDETLAYMDRDYLSSFDAIKVDSAIALQAPPAKTVERTAAYPVAPGEPLTEKTMLSMNIVAGEATDAETHLAFQALSYLLLQTPAAPLKNALIDAGIGKEVSGSFTKSICQPVFSIEVTGTEAEKKDLFIKTVYKTLQQLTIKGIDKSLIEATLNLLEFKLREADFGSYPKGLMYAIQCMDSWLYDDDPLRHLQYEKTLSAIREKALSGRYFESMIEEKLLDNTHRVVVTLTPDTEILAQREAAQTELLRKIKESWTTQEINRTIEETTTLLAAQGAPESEENLATIPLLDRSDIKPTIEILPCELESKNGVHWVTHPMFTNQIAYVTYYFNGLAVDEADLPYAFLLTDLLSKLSTKKHSFQELANELDRSTGGVSFDLQAVSSAESNANYTLRFSVGGRALLSKQKELFALLTEILTETRFDDIKRLKDLIAEEKTTWDNQFFSLGQKVIASRLLSYFSPVSRLNEQGVLQHYRFLAQIIRLDETGLKKLGDKLSNVTKQLFCRKDVYVSLCSDETALAELRQTAGGLLEKLPETSGAFHQYVLAGRGIVNEAILTAGQVQYVAAGGNFKTAGYAYTGALRVLDTIMRYDYLWSRIRVQGGAYGAYTQFDRNGNVLFGSYRDPNLTETLETFRSIPDFLRSFAPSPREMTKFVIGTMSQVDRPLTPVMKADRAMSHLIRGISAPMRQQERDEILRVTVSDIQALADLTEASLAEGYCCALGNRSKLMENKKVFGALVEPLPVEK